MAKILMVANWKMNPPTFRDAKKLLEKTKKVTAKVKSVSLIVAPPALYLRELAKGGRGARISFAAQNAHFDAKGAHTGEISMQQVKDAGAAYVLVGHSEIRAHGETNDDTRKEITTALSARLSPILCIGETERTATGVHFNIIQEQLRVGLKDVSQSALSRVIIAYEPVWAIGGEKAIIPRDMHEIAIFIRKTLVDMHGNQGYKTKILYGGSVSEENARSMLRDGDVVGLLVGHVSVDIERFTKLIQSLA